MDHRSNFIPSTSAGQGGRKDGHFWFRTADPDPRTVYPSVLNGPIQTVHTNQAPSSRSNNSQLIMFPPRSLHCALSDSVASGVFVDTKFYLFSRRNSSGKVFRPRPLYVNSHILRSVQYFDDREYFTAAASPSDGIHPLTQQGNFLSLIRGFHRRHDKRP